MFGIDLNCLTKELQKKFASSASVTLIPGNLIFLILMYLLEHKNSLHRIQFFNAALPNNFLAYINSFYCAYRNQGMVKEREIIIQGRLASEVEMYLISTYDMPKHLIASKVLKGVKAKKK